MSADNWTTCPRCYTRAINERAKRRRWLCDQYGEITRNQYEDKLLAFRSERTITPDMFETLREDFSIGLRSTGLQDQSSVFNVKYEANCTECGFSFEYDHSENAYIAKVVSRSVTRKDEP